MDLRGLVINKPVNPEHGYSTGRYERNWNTLYVGGLPVEWNEPQVGWQRLPYAVVALALPCAAEAACATQAAPALCFRIALPIAASLALCCQHHCQPHCQPRQLLLT